MKKEFSCDIRCNTIYIDYNIDNGKIKLNSVKLKIDKWFMYAPEEWIDEHLLYIYELIIKEAKI